MNDKPLYSESVSSPKTEALFVTLTLLFFTLLIRRLRAGSRGILTALFFFLSSLFLFYVLNYRTLIIQLTAHALKLTFGIFTWTVPVENIASCHLDEIPTLMRLGGAGIHFMSIRRRYRASFNFLEHPRVVIALKRKAGPVRDISFSTRRPAEVIKHIQEAMSANEAQLTTSR